MFYKPVGAIVLLSLINGFLSASIDSTDDSDRIIGGVDVPISRFPYQVSLQYNNHHICGGCIYNSQLILTAAHCVYSFKADNLQYLSVLLGTSSLDSGGIRIPFQSFVKHQYYNNNNLTYDLAIVKMKSPVNFTSSIQPIALASKTPESGAKVVVTGWGVLKNSDTEPSRNLQGAELDFISRADCASPPNTYRSESISPTMICAGDQQKGSCKGDSGGPLVELSSNKLLGVVSWGGITCAAFGNPGVYTNIPALSNWIKNLANHLSKK